jgi:integrase
VSDVLNIKKNQIAKEMSIRERKTKKYKSVEISDALFLRLKQQMGFTINSYMYVFSSPHSSCKPLHRSTYHRHIKKAAKGICGAASAHSARKLYAQNKFIETGSVVDVQKALQHKYITTTAAYLDIDINKLISEVKPA